MNGHHSVAEEIEYSRKLIHAGIQGLHSSVANPKLGPELAVAANSSLKAAVIGAGVAWMGCTILKQRTQRGRITVACGALAFCADFGWKTRVLGSQLLNGAAKAVSEVRDQHWLESNPIDYA